MDEQTDHCPHAETRTAMAQHCHRGSGAGEWGAGSPASPLPETLQLPLPQPGFRPSAGSKPELCFPKGPLLRKPLVTEPLTASTRFINAEGKQLNRTFSKEFGSRSAGFPSRPQGASPGFQVEAGNELPEPCHQPDPCRSSGVTTVPWLSP